MALVSVMNRLNDISLLDLGLIQFRLKGFRSFCYGIESRKLRVTDAFDAFSVVRVST